MRRRMSLLDKTRKNYDLDHFFALAVLMETIHFTNIADSFPAAIPARDPRQVFTRKRVSFSAMGFCQFWYVVQIDFFS